MVLHGYSYVPGVTVSGKVSAAGAKLKIGGSKAVHGTIEIDAHGILTGTLAGQRVRVAAPKADGLEAGESSLDLQEQASVEVQARLSGLLADPKRLQAVKAGGESALLRYMVG